MEIYYRTIITCVGLLSFIRKPVYAPGPNDPSPIEDPNFDPYTTMDPKYREPSPCEVCKYFVVELEARLAATGKSKEIMETGHGLDLKKKRIPYKTSETRLEESLRDPHICQKMLDYNVHAERKGSNRYAKGRSETMSTLEGLVQKGVKVDLGIPHELWHKPPSESTKMERWCYDLVEDLEDDIEHWYYRLQESHKLMDYICRDRYLKGKDQKCLEEKFTPKGEEESERNQHRSKPKNKKKSKKSKGKTKGDEGKDEL